MLSMTPFNELISACELKLILFRLNYLLYTDNNFFDELLSND